MNKTALPFILGSEVHYLVFLGSILSFPMEPGAGIHTLLQTFRQSEDQSANNLLPSFSSVVELKMIAPAPSPNNTAVSLPSSLLLSPLD